MYSIVVVFVLVFILLCDGIPSLMREEWIAGVPTPEPKALLESTNATPGARYQSALCSTTQFLWLFGGFGYPLGRVYFDERK
jgi:hypothetical protein